MKFVIPFIILFLASNVNNATTAFTPTTPSIPKTSTTEIKSFPPLEQQPTGTPSSNAKTLTEKGYVRARSFLLPANFFNVEKMW